ncbi:MAG: type 4a pilus biogenesis protein PilO [Comamonas sp.]
MAKKGVALGEYAQKFQQQFRNLDPKDPSVWPAVPKALMLMLVAAIVIGLAWYAYLSDFEDSLQAGRAEELKLKDQYKDRARKAANLEALKKQREQIQQYVIQLEKQLPSKAEMATLLSDINQAGIGRSLQFELFRPGQVLVKDYYAELPISIKINGKYHDVGAFAADVANLSRIVTLNNVSLTPSTKDSDTLTMETTARTFRYLDEQEIAQQQSASSKQKKK